jgi:hypothetical protein
MGAAIIAIGAMGASLGACASDAASTPAWYNQAVASTPNSYPSLSERPRPAAVVTDPAHWNAVISDSVAAREAMQANPRNEPAGADTSQGFVDQAHQDIEQSRAAH